MRAFHFVTILTVACIVMLFAADARAQAFFTPGVTSYSPEISVVNSGILHDVQATVSPDRKYVTLTMRPQVSQLIALQEFSLATGATTQPAFVGAGQLNTSTGVLGSINEPFLLGSGQGSALLRQRGMTPIRVR